MGISWGFGALPPSSPSFRRGGGEGPVPMAFLSIARGKRRKKGRGRRIGEALETFLLPAGERILLLYFFVRAVFYEPSSFSSVK